MSKNVRVGVKGGSRSTQAVDPAGLGQLGAAQGGRIKGSGSFTGINSSKPVFEGDKAAAIPMGNQVALNVKGAPGAGRVVMRSGSQGRH
jgi:hypothetical protein